MKYFPLTCALCLSASLPAWASHGTTAQVEQPHLRAFERPDHDPIGEPAEGVSIDRTIDVTIRETESGYMLFEPDAVHIEKGSVVRFAIRNAGVLDHEFFLGSFDEIEEHMNWMREHPDMKHQDANAVSVRRGDIAQLDWKFSTRTNLEFACLLPGHREAGMWGVIIVHDHLAPKSKG